MYSRVSPENCKQTESTGSAPPAIPPVYRRLQRGDARFDILDLNGLGRVIEDCFCPPVST